MDRTRLIHERILDYLINEHKKNPTFYFATRLRNNNARLDEGYWFQGNDGYVYVSFWEGGDWQRKVRNIGFVVDSKTKKSWIELSAKEDYDKIPFMEIITDKLGFYNGEADGIFYKEFSNDDYMRNLKSFLLNEKVEIDQLIMQYKPKGISLIRADDFNKYKNTIARRDKQIIFGKTNKIARLCWNENGWKYPSGARGKSMNGYSYENRYGFGHEEWLFDKSKNINGCHYAFIEAFRIIGNHHIDKIYNVKLYSINSHNNRKYYIGEIKNLTAISEEESKSIYEIYSERGWIQEMIQQVKTNGGEWKPTTEQDSCMLFNVKFCFDDAILFDEYKLIAENDININSTHFVLLPLKTEVSVEVEDEEDDWTGGNYKNTTLRNKTINQNITYDPYHDRMQNALFDLFKGQSHIYQHVQIENNRVDLKAKTVNGEWHYFEIKTDSAKLSIRKAIGQIMEYSFYPDKKRASKLFIISDSKPSAEDIAYLNFVRLEFGIPLYYRFFILENNELSADF